MVTKENRDVILLPIFPEYANAIFEGRKKVEFRKLNIPSSIGHVVVYCTAPTKKIIGFFEVNEITQDTPLGLWNAFRKVGGICKELLMKYYSGHEQGIAIHVGKFRKLRTPLDLNFIEENLSAPQSFMYLQNSHLNRIKQFVV